MTEPIQPTPELTVPPAGTPSRDSRWARVGKKNLAFGAGGIVLGLLLGLPLGGLAGPGRTASTAKAIAAAVDACSATGKDGIEILDDGASLEMKTVGKGYGDTGAPDSYVDCVLDKLHTPDSVISRMDGTRALDGTVESQWDGFTASWTYHPDNGLRVVVETAHR